jgi:hypothetical protein
MTITGNIQKYAIQANLYNMCADGIALTTQPTAHSTLKGTGAARQINSAHARFVDDQYMQNRAMPVLGARLQIQRHSHSL